MQKLFLVIIAFCIIFGFIFANFLVHWLISFVVGSILSTFVILAFYYFGARFLITNFAFPGSSFIAMRKLEFQFGQKMAQ